MTLNFYEKFKCILEYFVTHLEYVQTKSTQIPGYKHYIAPIKNFKYTGVGWKQNQRIQQQVADWEDYNGHILCINVSNRPGSYMTPMCYLNWRPTWLNIRAKWDEEAEKIMELAITTDETAKAEFLSSYTISDLGLFDNAEPNDNLKHFFDIYYNLIVSLSNNETMQPLVNLLKANKNLILTGAPGTGKSYLAKKIAEEMGATEETIKMVQFHQSYDYTDFVEGLRPIQSETESNIGFERRDGVFKEFCAKALENYNKSQNSPQTNNESALEDAYRKLVADIANGSITEIPLKSEGSSMDAVEISNQGNIILKAKDAKTDKTYTISFNRIKKLSAAYPTKEGLDKISNIYEAVRDAIKGCNTSAYWATLRFIYDKYYQKATHPTETVELKPYVFIIDEINRGEMSKIFGELFFAIDPGYRGEKGRIGTQYQNLLTDSGDVFEDGFFVPKNVYIIGTMNDIDRSVESIDFAMRRRFAWKEITAKMRQGMLDEAEAWDGNMPSADIIAKIKNRMDNLNAAIEKIGLTSAYHIGAAYFLKYALYNDFDMLWDNHLRGLIYEYLRGTTGIEDKITKLRNAYNDDTQH